MKNIYHPSDSHNYNPFFFVTDSPYWFMQSYLALYLFAPVANRYLDDSSRKQKMYMLVVLLFLSSYCGYVGSPSYLTEGKNLVNFLLIYVIGNAIREWKDEILRVGIFKLLALYVGLNAVLFCCYIWENPDMQRTILKLAYNYSSPLIIVNAVLIFIMLSRINVQSIRINYIASSTLAVYLIHVHPAICGSAFKMPLLFIQNYTANTFLICILYLVYAILFFFVCVLIDKALTPLWNQWGKVLTDLNQRLLYVQ